MSKLNKYERIQRKKLITTFKKEGGRLFRDEETGTTVAVMPVNPGYRNPKFAFVSTSFCSFNDKWSRKYGEYRALTRIYMGQYIKMPIPNVDNGADGDNRFYILSDQVCKAYYYCASQ